MTPEIKAAGDLIHGFQIAGKLCALIDLDHCVKIEDLEEAGVDAAKLLVSQPSRPFVVIETFVRCGALSLVVAVGDSSKVGNTEDITLLRDEARRTGTSLVFILA